MTMDSAPITCRCCRAPGADVRFTPCGCLLHAKCVPIQLFIVDKTGVRQPNTVTCPFCSTSTIAKVHILPMTTELLDQAAAEKRTEGNTEDVTATESPYLLLSGSSAMNHELRTGRWAEEEMDFCDFLMQTFEKGLLPMASGVRLNDFLCNMLLCKASRLTKKMKNARLSSRSYLILAESGASPDFELFSQLQERFLSSVTVKSTRLELRFHMDKTWRTNLSNLCIQIGSQLLDASDWLTSLEALESRGVAAEENIRKSKRKRMVSALRTDVHGQEGVQFSHVPIQPTKPASISHSSSEHAIPTLVRSEEMMTKDHISTMLDAGQEIPEPQPLDVVDDLTALLRDIDQPSSSSCSSPMQHSSFLEQVMSYIEASQLPFQHVDVWVPSYQTKGGQLRLYHAGHASRNDCFSALHEYGEYSTRFSFPTGVGLPGRVYATGKSSWETRLDLQDPKIFERAGGARVYGVQTGIGIPLTSAFVGRLVLAAYSVEDLPLNEGMLRTMERDLAPLCPKPKWKLVVEMDDTDVGPPPDSINVPEALPAAMEVEPPQKTDREIEIEIANLLTKFLPADPYSAGNSESSQMDLHSYYTSLRLLLLTLPERRNSQDASLLEILRRSYEGFITQGSNTRTPKEISDQLVKDWKHLKASEEVRASDRRVEHQSLVMNQPRIQTFAPQGAPTRAPFALGRPTDFKKRRTDSPEMLNIVDDSA